MSLEGDHTDASHGDTSDFGEELAGLSEAELERRANKSVQDFYSRTDQEPTEWRESILEDEAKDSLDEFYSHADQEPTEWRESILEDEAEDAFQSHQERFKGRAEAALDRHDSRFGQFVDTGLYPGLSQSGGTGGSDCTAVSVDLSDDDRLEGAKAQTLDIVAQNPNGVQFSEIAVDVLGQSAVSEATYEYKQLLDFVRDSEYVQTDKDGGIWVKPSLHLRQQYAKHKTAGQQTGSLSNDKTGAKLDIQYPKDRAKSILSKQTRLEGGDDRPDYRQEVVQELATELANIDDKYTIFERLRGQGSDYLLVPYLTRFNSPQRAQRTKEGLKFALETAAERYHNGVLLEVTVDPKRHDSHAAALESLQEGKANLLQWLSTDYQLGYRPDNLSVLEFQDNGLPHYHILLCGVTWLCSQEQLSAKWSDLGVGSVVNVRGITTRSGTWLMHKDGRTQTLWDYIGKSVRELVTLSELSPGELDDRLDDGDGSLWRQGLYWATGKQYWTSSRSLKESTDSDTVPHVSVWSFVGVAEYAEIPSHVREGAVRMDRPPPD